MKKVMNKYSKWIIAIFFVIGVGILGEVIYNAPISKQADLQYLQPDQIKADGFDLADGYYISKGEENEIILSFPEQYVDKIYYRYINPEEAYHDDNDSHGQRSTTINIRRKLDSYTISLPDKVTGVNISEIAIDNTGNYSTARALFFSLCAAFVVLIISLLKNQVKWRLEQIFLVTALSVGCLMVFALPTHKVGLDEEIHFGKAFYLFDTLAGRETITFPPHMSELLTVSSLEWPYRIPQSEEENKQEKSYWDEHLKYNFEETTDKYQESGYQLNMSTFSYFPQALMIRAGIFLRLDFTTIFAMGRLGNLLMYCLVVFLAIRHIVIGKRLMMVLGLMPTALFSATTYSYDATIIAFFFLGIAYLITELVNEKEHISYKNCAIFTVALLFASAPKPVYIPMILLALFFKNTKFRNNKEKFIFKGLITVAFLAMLSSIMLPALSSTATSLGDIRGGDTSVSRQLQYVFAEPLRYTKLLLSNIASTFFPYMFGDKGLGGMGHLLLMHCNIPIVALLAYTVLTDKEGEKGQKIRTMPRVAIAILSFAIMCLIWTALYLMFTPVGLNEINGVQGRYYIPITMFLALALSIKDIKGFLKQHIDYAIITTVSLGILMFVVYNQIIVRAF